MSMILSRRLLFRSLMAFCMIGLLVLTAMATQPQRIAKAQATLTVTPITWNVIGLDKDDLNAGPNEYPVGVRVCNTGTAAVNNISVSFDWTGTANNNLSVVNPVAQTISTLTASAPCDDVYFWVRVQRVAESRNS